MRLTHKLLRSHFLSAISDFARQHTDLTIVVVLGVLTLVTEGDLFRDEVTLGSDAATQYYPFYYFLGESLRSGSIPGWNPYQFSGTPFAADPLTGWAYLPTMLLFAVLPLTAAVKSLMFSHLLLAGLSTYALARILGMGIPGALLAAIAYEYSGLFYVQNTCCLQYIGVMAWLPVAMVGAELAIRSARWLERGVWWALSGLGLSQILASWFGQGSYYALLALGGYIAYRTLLSSATNEDVGSIRRRVSRLFLHGGAVLLFGFTLGAAGVLPRLEYNALSNLAGGYPAEISARGGWVVADWALLLEPGVWYAGISVVSLALVAPLLARRRFAVPYFFFLSLGALVLTAQGPTPLHSVLYLLPHFQQLHPHSPERVLVVFYLGVALLAGAALTGLTEQTRAKPFLLFSLLLGVLFLASTIILFPPRPEGWVSIHPLYLENGLSVPADSLLFLVLAVVLVAAYALIPARLASWRGLAFVMLALVVVTDLLRADRAIEAQQNLTGQGWLVRIREVDLTEYYSPSGAARFLQSKSQEESFRYFGFDPGSGGEGYQFSAPLWFGDPDVQALETNGRPMLLGLQNIQGYNPTHIARYDEYMSELNGGYEQNYHFIDVFKKGLNSPLLDLLNVRYIIVPAQPSQENPEGARQFEEFESTHPTVYEDDKTKVLENQHTLPRAWIVHSAQQVGSQKEALDLLSSGEVNPKETALLEEEPPQQMSQPDDASAERAEVTDYQANQVQVKTSAGAPGLLMLSEVYYPAWKAYVDGQPAPVHVSDQLLRSVEIPAGEHTIELRYESWALGAGVVISLVAYAVLIVLLVVAGSRHWRQKAIATQLC